MSDNNSNSTLVALLAVLVLAFGVLIGYYFCTQHQGRSREPSINIDVPGFRMERR